MSRPHGRKPASLPAQQFALRQLYPEASCSLHGQVLIWRGRLRPSALSRDYEVSIRYDGWGTPRVHVLSPSLREIADQGFAPGRPLPHVYPEENDPLCLFQGEREWNRAKLIASTTVPWTALWLAFFEVWVVTNTWEGSGAPYVGEPKVA